MLFIPYAPHRPPVTLIVFVTAHACVSVVEAAVVCLVAVVFCSTPEVGSVAEIGIAGKPAACRQRTEACEIVVG